MSAVPSPVLVTGATGFIGRHLIDHLLECGIAVRALVRPASLGRVDGRCEVVAGELDDPHAWDRALDGAAAVVYGAGAVRGRRLTDFVPANVAGVAALVDGLRRRVEAPPVVLLSSLAASRPELSHYAGSKRSGEHVLEAVAALPWSILRPPAVYGPGDSEMRPLFELARRGVVLRPGPRHQRVSLLHVHDLVRAVLACLGHEAACRHRTFALDDGHSEGYTWNEIALAVAGRPVRQIGVPAALLRVLGAANAWAAAVLGYAPMLTPGKVRELQQPSWLCDNRAFTHATGWQPEIDLERGAAALFHRSQHS